MGSDYAPLRLAPGQKSLSSLKPAAVVPKHGPLLVETRLTTDAQGVSQAQCDTVEPAPMAAEPQP